MSYKIAIFIFKLLFKVLFRIKAYGLENIPRQGGIILAINHNSSLDPFAVGVTFPRKVYFMAKEELFKVPVLKSFIVSCGAFPVKRGKVDKKSFKNALKIIKNGEVLGMFPEGNRSEDGDLQRGHPGMVRIASMSNTPLLPVAIQGTEKALPKRAKFIRLHPIKVFYGKPIWLNDNYQKREKKELLLRDTQMVMDQIARLLEIIKV